MAPKKRIAYDKLENWGVTNGKVGVRLTDVHGHRFKRVHLQVGAHQVGLLDGLLDAWERGAGAIEEAVAHEQLELVRAQRRVRLAQVKLVAGCRAARACADCLEDLFVKLTQ